MRTARAHSTSLKLTAVLPQAVRELMQTIRAHGAMIDKARLLVRQAETLRHVECQTMHSGSLAQTGTVVKRVKKKRKKRGDLHDIVSSIGKGYKPRQMLLANMLQFIDEVLSRVH